MIINLLHFVSVCFISVCSMYNSLDHTEIKPTDNVQLTTDKPINNVVNISNTQFFLSSSDITFEKFYYGILHDIGAFMRYDYPEDYTYSFESGDEIRYVNVRNATWDLDNNVLDIANWTPYALQSYSIIKDYLSPTLCNYQLKFHWNVNNNPWTLWFNYRVLHDLHVDNASTTGEVTIEQQIFYTNTISNTYTYYQFSLEFTHGEEQYNLVKWFCYYMSDYEQGVTDGFNSGYSNGYNAGYDAGVASSDYDPRVNSIFSGILEVGLLPINFFLAIFNFEVFGINISGIVSAFLTIAIVIIIIRFITGGKNSD